MLRGTDQIPVSYAKVYVTKDHKSLSDRVVWFSESNTFYRWAESEHNTKPSSANPSLRFLPNYPSLGFTRQNKLSQREKQNKTLRFQTTQIINKLPQLN